MTVDIFGLAVFYLYAIKCMLIFGVKWYNDLMFTDDTVRLIRVPDNEKGIPQFVYYLGNDFIAQVKKLQKFTCVAVGSGSAPRTSLIPVYLISIISIIRLFL